ncbi:MAG: hypothetical protein KDD35_03025 [Bdellovibrionales bacterium]|nr:hypothetical protein [Bdellovibrionales bacterium]
MILRKMPFSFLPQTLNVGFVESISRKSTKVIFIVLSLSAGFCTQIQDLAAFESDSIEAYRFAYEKRLEDRFRKNLDSILIDVPYALEVDVLLKPTEVIDRLVNPVSELEVQEKKENNLKENTNPLALFSDQAPQGEEFALPLTKLGMWKLKNGAEKEQEDPTINEKPKKKVFLNFKDLLASIELRLLMDQSVTQDQEKAAQRILKDFGQLIGNPKVNVRVSKSAFVKKEVVEKDKEKEEEAKRDPAALEEEKKKEQEEKEKAESEALLERIMQLKIPIAIVLCAIIFLLGINMASRSYQKIESKRLNLLSEQSKREETMLRAQYNKEDEASQSKPIESHDLVRIEETQVSVLGKFRQVMSGRPQLTSLLIKRWIRFQADGALEALNLISRSIEVDQLNSLLETLTDDEKSLWSQKLSAGFSDQEKVRAIQFIEKELLSNMLAPEEKIDASVKSVIYSVTLEEALECIRRDVTLGATLISFMQSVQVARIIDLLNPDQVASLSSRGIQLSKKETLANVGQLYMLINQMRKEKQVESPFVSNIPSLMSELSLEKERSLFVAYASQNSIEDVKELAMKFFPSELIFSLPSELVRRSLDQLSVTKRAELVAISDEDQAKQILDLFGQSKTREILEEELVVINEQESRLRELKKNRRVLLKNFVIQTRNLIAQSPEYEEQIGEVLDNWALAIQSEGQGALRAVA